MHNNKKDIKKTAHKNLQIKVNNFFQNEPLYLNTYTTIHTKKNNFNNINNKALTEGSLNKRKKYHVPTPKRKLTIKEEKKNEPIIIHNSEEHENVKNHLIDCAIKDYKNIYNEFIKKNEFDQKYLRKFNVLEQEGSSNIEDILNESETQENKPSKKYYNTYNCFNISAKNKKPLKSESPKKILKKRINQFEYLSQINFYKKSFRNTNSSSNDNHTIKSKTKFKSLSKDKPIKHLKTATTYRKTEKNNNTSFIQKKKIFEKLTALETSIIKNRISQRNKPVKIQINRNIKNSKTDFQNSSLLDYNEYIATQINAINILNNSISGYNNYCNTCNENYNKKLIDEYEQEKEDNENNNNNNNNNEKSNDNIVQNDNENISQKQDSDIINKSNNSNKSASLNLSKNTSNIHISDNASKEVISENNKYNSQDSSQDIHNQLEEATAYIGRALETIENNYIKSIKRNILYTIKEYAKNKSKSKAIKIIKKVINHNIFTSLIKMNIYRKFEILFYLLKNISYIREYKFYFYNILRLPIIVERYEKGLEITTQIIHANIFCEFINQLRIINLINLFSKFSSSISNVFTHKIFNLLKSYYIKDKKKSIFKNVKLAVQRQKNKILLNKSNISLLSVSSEILNTETEEHNKSFNKEPIKINPKFFKLKKRKKNKLLSFKDILAENDSEKNIEWEKSFHSNNSIRKNSNESITANLSPKREKEYSNRTSSNYNEDSFILNGLSEEENENEQNDKNNIKDNNKDIKSRNNSNSNNTDINNINSDDISLTTSMNPPVKSENEGTIKIKSDNKTKDNKNSFTEAEKLYLVDNITTEIINEILSTEVINKEQILVPKNDIKLNKTLKNSLTASFDSKSSEVDKMSVINSLENSFNMNSNSIFLKTVKEKKKEEELTYYDNKVLPKVIQSISDNINKNYKSIIHRLEVPYKMDPEQVMNKMIKLMDEGEYQNQFDFINKKQLENKTFINKNEVLKDNSNDIYESILNECMVDAADELIEDERLYKTLGEPLPWSIRTREAGYMFKDNDFSKQKFNKKIVDKLKKYAGYKIGIIEENNSNDKTPSECENKMNEIVKEEICEEVPYNPDNEDSYLKLILSNQIKEQLLNEVIEILEHIQNNRRHPDKYDYKSIYGCDVIPKLSFQMGNEEEDMSNRNIITYDEDDIINQ